MSDQSAPRDMKADGSFVPRNGAIDWSAARMHWYRRALPAYWVFLFTATHLPKLQLGGPSGSDKLVHFVAFGLLAFLFWKFWETFDAMRRRGAKLRAWLWLVAYAGMDEYLQQFVGRGTEWEDWFANVFGISAVLLILILFEWAKARRGPAAPV